MEQYEYMDGEGLYQIEGTEYELTETAGGMWSVVVLRPFRSEKSYYVFESREDALSFILREYEVDSNE